MTFDMFPAYLVTATLLTMAPGLDTATVLRSAMVQGPTHGAATTAGVAIGCFCWGSAAAFGLARLFQDAPVAGAFLRLAGALYLAYLGGRLLLRPHIPVLLDASADPARPAQRLGGSLLCGFATNILNPKVGIFYLTLLPQFAPGGGGNVQAAWLLAMVHVGIAALWFLALSVLAGGLRRFLQSPRVAMGIDRVSGVIFLLLGAGLIHSAAMTSNIG